MDPSCSQFTIPYLLCEGRAEGAGARLRRAHPRALPKGLRPDGVRGHSLLDIFRDKQLVFVQGTLDKYHHSLLVIVPEIPCALSYDSCNPGEHSNELSLWYSMLTTAAYKHVNKWPETVAVPIQAAGSNNCGPATILFGEKVAGLYKDWISLSPLLLVVALATRARDYERPPRRTCLPACLARTRSCCRTSSARAGWAQRRRKMR